MSRLPIPVVIPAFNPPPGLPQRVQAILRAGAEEVVVVDDGSAPEHAETWAQLSQSPQVTVLSHPVNQGKGAALRTATKFLMHRGDAAGMVTADADGQHSADDVASVLSVLGDHIESERHGGRVGVIGARNFDVAGVPFRSRLGNRATTTVIRGLYGRSMPDTQTGLRGFGRDLFSELLSVPGDRYDYEMRVLLRLLKNHVDVTEVPISTLYTDEENSSSHFRPIRDSAVIYGAIFKEGGAFAIASLLGAAVDIAVFTLVIDAAFGGASTSSSVLVSTVLARIVSTMANYAANRRLVFDSRTSVLRSGPRYYGLAAGLLTASWLLTTALAQALGGHVVWAKVIVDSGLFAVSYVVQKRWVFRG